MTIHCPLLALILLTLTLTHAPAPAADSNPPPTPPTAPAHYFLDGVDQAPTLEVLKKNLLLAQEWKEATYDNKKFIFAITDIGDGESYIDLHGWIYNRAFKEWRRILTLKTRNLGNYKLQVDQEKGLLILKGAANNDLNGVEVFRFDLRATSDDAGYVR